MKKLAALFLLAGASGLSAQSTAYDSAFIAWERGQYITALDGMLRVLRSSSGDVHHDRIALLTGELYHTSELAADGRNVRWSPDGSHGLYETGIGANRRTRVIAQRGNATPPVTITEFAGYNAIFSSDGQRIVALQPVETPEITTARSQLASLSGARSTR
jgi:hypothetical protein